MIVDISKLHLKLLSKKEFNVINFEDADNDFSDFEIKNINVFEYEIVEEEDLEKKTSEV